MNNQILREFKQVSIKQNCLRVVYDTYVTSSGDTFTIAYRNATPIHPDLDRAMQRLSVHVGKIIGQDTPPGSLRITGFLRQNSGDAQLLTIYTENLPVQHGRRPVANSAVRLYIGRDEYDAIDLLLEDLACCEREALQYIDNGKTYEYEQALHFTDDDLALLTPAA